VATKRYRWILPVELFWLLEAVVCVGALLTPGVAGAFVGTLIFVPTTVSHFRNGRSIGLVGRVWSAVIIDLQAAVVLIIPLFGDMDQRDWLLWGPAAAIGLVLGVGAWASSGALEQPVR
jgi:hypothetical protein